MALPPIFAEKRNLLTHFVDTLNEAIFEPVYKIAKIKKIEGKTICFTLKNWSEWRDLNSRPLDPQSSALPTAPHPDSERYNITVLLFLQ